MRSVRVVTGSRAEYGLLRPLIERLLADKDLDTSIWVTGTHLEPRYGMTVRDIEADGWPIAARIPMQLDDDSEEGISQATARALAGFGAAIAQDRPDCMVVLGDRFEVFAASAAALLSRVPIAHIHGGELTLGAVDDAIRHAVTKMSTLHFTSAEPYRRRVIQMGEDPSRVWTVGALGVDNAKRLARLTKAELETELGPLFGRATALATFHPVTLERVGSAAAQIAALLGAIEAVEGLSVIFTMPNADAGNRAIFSAIEAFVEAHPDRARAFTSLGVVRYLSLMEHSQVVIGNSSSGIVEAPSMGTPTVDIGDRQAGRITGPSVIHCEPDAESISAALGTALSEDMQRLAARRENVYGDGHAAEKIASVLSDQVPRLDDSRKRFYDLPVVPDE